MTSAGDIIMNYVCPALGLLIANLMFFAPYRDLKTAIARGHLGTLNPTPWVFMFGNCFGWVVYSFLKRNFWIFFSNCPGLILSVWLNLGAVKLLYQGHFSNEMRRNFTEYLEQESKKQQQEKQHGRSPSAQADNNNNMGTFDSLFTNDDSNNDQQQQNSSETTTTHEQQQQQHDTRTPSGVSVADLVADMFSGPVVGPGHKRTLSADIASEVYLENPTPLIDAPAVEHDNNQNDNQNRPTHHHRRNPSETVAEAVVEVVEATLDFAKVVWDVTSQTTPAPAPHECMVMWVVVSWIVVVCVISFTQAINSSTKALIVGGVTNLNLVFFYGAPLSTIFTVIKERNSESIHVPTMITNTMSSTFWMVYGLSIGDWFVAAPNALGTLLGGVQISMYVMYPRTNPNAVRPAEKDEEQVMEITPRPSSSSLSADAAADQQTSSSLLFESPITPIEQLNKDLEDPILPPLLSAEVRPAGPTILEDETFNDSFVRVGYIETGRNKAD